MRIGWIQDTHTHADPNDSPHGAQQRLVADYNYLANSSNVDTIYHGGDLCHADTPADEVPHIEPAAYDQFFNLINQTDDPTLLERAVPGNHDIPLSTFLAADDRCVLRDRIDYPAANLSALFINTQATGFVTGSPGRGEQGGVGTEVVRVPKADVEWMDRQLAEINNAGNTALIVPHAALTPIPSCPYTRVNGYRGNINDESLYNIVTNHRACQAVLADHASSGLDIVVPTSHLYYFGGEGSETIGGVNYVYKKHYWKGTDDSLYTFSYIDIDGTSATVKTVDHNSHNETTILDVTF